MNCSPPGSSIHGIFQVRILEWVSVPLPGDLPNPEIEPTSPASQAYSLLSEAPGQSKNTRVGSLSLLQRNLLTQESNRGLLNCRQVLYQLSYPGSPIISSVQFSSVAQLCLTLCNPRNCLSMSSMLCIPR